MRLVTLCALAALAGPAQGYVAPPAPAPVAVMAALDAGFAPATSATRRGAPQGKPLAQQPAAIVTAAGPGQSGYVHFFLLGLPDGTEEVQVGVELPDGRIAWSFPELGVVVAPFMAGGELEVNGRVYTVRHQYGMRPFADDAAMRALQRDLGARVAFWVEDGAPYCNPPPAHAGRLCMSCLGFVLRVLFPGRTPAHPALPRNFPLSGSDGYYSTDDLLLYLTGLDSVPTRAARLRRIDALALPPALRRDLVQLVESIDDARVAGAGSAPRSLNEKMRSGVRTYSRTPPQKKRL